MNVEEIGSMVVRLIGDASSYVKMMTDAVTQARTTANEVEHASNRIQSFGFGMRRFALDAMGALAPLAGVMSTLGGAFKGVKLAAASEQMEISFGTMLASLEEGKELTKELQKFADTTPLRMQGVTQAAKVLLQFGVAGDQLIPIMRTLGDVSGGVDAKLQSMALAFGHVTSTGHLMGRDIRMMIHAGFNPLMEMARTTGRTMEDLYKATSKGEISAQMVVAALRSATSEGGRFKDMMERQSKTTTGLFSTMQDSIDAFFRVLGRDIIELFHLNDAMKAVSNAAMSMSNWLKKLDPDLKQFVVGIFVVVAAVSALALAWPLLAYVARASMRSLIGIVDVLLGPINLIGIAIAAAAGIWIKSVGGMTEAFNIVQEKAAEVWEALLPVREAVETVFGVLWVVLKNIESIAASLEPVWDALVEGFFSAVEAVKEFIIANREVIATVLALTAAVGIAYAAFKILAFTITTTWAVLSALGITQLASIGLWLAWKAIVLLATGTLALFNVQMAFWKFALVAGNLALVALTIAFAPLIAVTWAWNAALSATNVLLGFAGIFAAIGTIVALGAAFAVVYAAVMAVHRAVGALISTDFSGMIGPINTVAGLFQEWWEILKDVAKLARMDMPRAWELLTAGFELAVLQVKAIWPSLWAFIKEGFFSLWDLVSSQAIYTFRVTRQRIQDEQLAKVPIFGGMVTQGLDEDYAEADKAMSDWLSKRAQRRINDAAAAFKSASGALNSAEIEAQRRLIESLRASIPDIPSAEEQAEKHAAPGKAAAESFAEATKEVNKFDAALYSSAEGASRIAAYMDRLAADFAATTATTASGVSKSTADLAGGDWGGEVAGGSWGAESVVAAAGDSHKTVGDWWREQEAESAAAAKAVVAAAAAQFDFSKLFPGGVEVAAGGVGVGEKAVTVLERIDEKLGELLDKDAVTFEGADLA